mmetsp:Transcript_5536/g.8829  ORF Transcript_5536/g.8829 Transcript_5536/m.8829 type:complete len:211 (+) Transcript_5536:630-1262(+)
MANLSFCLEISATMDFISPILERSPNTRSSHFFLVDRSFNPPSISPFKKCHCFGFTSCRSSAPDDLRCFFRSATSCCPSAQSLPRSKASCEGDEDMSQLFLWFSSTRLGNPTTISLDLQFLSAVCWAVKEVPPKAVPVLRGPLPLPSSSIACPDRNHTLLSFSLWGKEAAGRAAMACDADSRNPGRLSTVALQQDPLQTWIPRWSLFLGS